eukprot:NODE_3752_length_923_cov_23.009153_g3450_i0.p1 GENE.NODE_3752_length_923_cov_23.009153_g3450_i0~~NODE_3752_length_923_cov_23.009153_g3450_i0.p1  ORF type:complete len:226 (+),score=64.66 NODE_3752_length_923_cov_23.009153_g3450_i0:159-836(+)
MNVVKEIERINKRELDLGLDGSERHSWHDQYRNSAYIFIGGLGFNLTEGDILCVFSQYGEPSDINLLRDKETGKSKGFCFLAYEDQRSTILAVDNLNGFKLAGRTLRVDHVSEYRPPEEKEGAPKRVTLKDANAKEAKEIRKQVKKEFKRIRKLNKKAKKQREGKRDSSDSDSDESEESPSKKKHRAPPPPPTPPPQPSKSSSSSSSSSSSGANGKPKAVRGAFD